MYLSDLKDDDRKYQWSLSIFVPDARPPRVVDLSKTSVSIPDFCNLYAQLIPLAPQPITATLKVFFLSFKAIYLNKKYLTNTVKEH